MADQNIQMKHNNGATWDNLFPKTKANLTTLESGKTVEETVNQLLTDLTSKTTIAQVSAEIKKVVGAAPEALDTLIELAEALGNDANFAATVTANLAGKVDKVAGKGLSTNDFTAALKTKLDGLKDHSSEISALQSSKADKTTTYTKVETDAALAAKAAAATTYTKTEVDTKVAGTYTKAEADTLLKAKAPQATTYTKVEVDTRMANLQANAIPVTAVQPVGASVWFETL